MVGCKSHGSVFVDRFAPDLLKDYGNRVKYIFYISLPFSFLFLNCSEKSSDQLWMRQISILPADTGIDKTRPNVIKFSNVMIML